MKSNKLLKLFLILSIFSICPINAMKKKASFAELSSFTKAKTFSAAHSLKSKFTFKNFLCGALVIGGIVAINYYFLPKYKARQERLERERLLKNERLKRERKDKDKKLLKNLDTNDIESVINFIRQVNNLNNIPKNISLKMQDHRKCTLLSLIAAHYNSIRKLQYVIDNCADVKEAINIQNTNGDTPLHTALKYCNYDNFVLLLECGADPTITNNKKESCTKIKHQLFLGDRLEAQPQKFITAVNYYAARKDRNLEKFIKNENNRDTCLEIAEKFGHQDTLKLLKK